MTMLLYVTARRSVVLARSGATGAWTRTATTTTTPSPLARLLLGRQVAASTRMVMMMAKSFSTDSKSSSTSSSSSSSASASASSASSSASSSSAQKPKELNAQFVTNDPRIPYKQRLKNLFTIYGPVAVVLHIGLSLTFLGATYLVVRYGFDVPAFLQSWGLVSEKYMLILANGGTFALAYALYKAAMPMRVIVTLLVTPAAARKLAHYGIIKRRF